MTLDARKTAVGPHTLYCGDAYAVLPAMPPPPGPLIMIMDPPYEFDASGGGQLRKNRAYMNDLESAGLADGFDLSIISAIELSACISFCHNDQLPKIINKMAGLFDKWAVCGWAKTNPMPVANKHYRPDLEPYVHGWSKQAHPRGGLPNLGRIWRGPVGKSDYGHPTQKPLSLMRKIVLNAASMDGAIVVDPFMGTGTTGVACAEAGVPFIGIEKEPRWFQVAARRIDAAHSQIGLFDGPTNVGLQSDLRGDMGDAEQGDLVNGG